MYVLSSSNDLYFKDADGNEYLLAPTSPGAGGPVTGSTNFFTINRLDAQGALLNSSGTLILSSSVGSKIRISGTLLFTSASFLDEEFNTSFVEFTASNINNLDSPSTNVRYGMRLFNIATGSSGESAAIYMRHAPVGAQCGIYGEITNAQADTEGSFVKVMHSGSGDAVYVALLTASAVAFEAATFADGTKGIISTVQSASMPNSVLFNALWQFPTIPNYGMFYAADAPGNAFTIQKYSGSAPDGQSQIRLVENDFARERFTVYNAGHTYLSSMTASATTTGQDSPELRFRGAYWDGGTTQNRDFVLKNIVDNVPSAQLRIYVNDALKFMFTEAGLDMQQNSIASAGPINWYADNNYDIGLITSQRPRNVYAGSSVYVGTTGSVIANQGHLILSSSAGSVVAISGGLKVQGAIHEDVKTITANTTFNINDSILLADCTAGNFNVYLPTPIPQGRRYTVKKIAGANNATLTGSASENIDGAATFLVDTLYETVTVIGSGTIWSVI